MPLPQPVLYIILFRSISNAALSTNHSTLKQEKCGAGQIQRAIELHTNMLCCCFAGKETVDDLFYYSTEYEPIGFVTVDDLFHLHISNLVAPLNFTSVFNL